MNEGVCLLMEDYADLGFPDVVFVPIAEINATLSLSLAWWPETEDAVVGGSIAFMRDRIAASSAPALPDGAPSQTPDPPP